MPKINRLTLMKIPEPAHREEAINKYSTLSQDAVKNGKPYILSAAMTPLLPDQRSQGYTLVARTVFESEEDMKFYDTECAAHGEIKALLKGKLESPPLMVYMELKE